MKRKNLLKLIVGVTLVAIMAVAIPLLSGCAAPAPEPTPEPTPTPTPEPTPEPEPAEEQPVFKLRGQAAQYSQQVNDYWLPWADKVEAMSGGRIEIEVFATGELMPDGQVFLALQMGTLDFALGHLENFCGAATETQMFGGYIPFAWETDLDLLVMWDYYGLDVPWSAAWEELGGVKVLDIWTGDPGLILTSKPVESYEDLAGLKLNAYTNVAEVLVDAGVSSIVLPAEEYYLAGTTGVLDGLAGWCGVKESYVNGFYEVFPYTLTNSLGVWQCFNVINLETWNSLPDDLQSILLESLHALRATTMIYYWEGEMRYRPYMKMTTLPDEDWDRVRTIAEGKWDEWAAGKPKAQAIIEIIRRYREESGR